MGKGRLRRFGTVRVRTTVAATAVVAVAMAAGGAMLVTVLTSSLEHNRQSVAISQAVNIADLAASGHLPGVLASPNEETTLSQLAIKPRVQPEVASLRIRSVALAATSSMLAMRARSRRSLSIHS
ncbi:MAG: hypothetical protein ACR2MN_05520, partial [Acidimicrobiales bacterium]